ncbi:MAG: alpha/beta hydrolase [Pseudomonadota bacterium]
MMAVFNDMDQDELDRQYDARGTVDSIDPYLDAYARLTREAKQTCTVRENISFGDHPDETFDLYMAGSNAPVFVFIHGGYWRALSKDESGFMAPCFVNQGVSVCIVNYSLAPAATLEQITDQVCRSVRFLQSNAAELDIDPGRIFLCGTSAGGHLAAMVLSEENIDGPPLAGFSLISGLFDLEPVRLTAPNEWLDLTRESARCCSPQFLMPRRQAPVQIAWAGRDTDEFKRQSRDYAALLKKHGFLVEAQEISDRNHFDIILDLTDPSRPLTKHVLGVVG